MGNNEEIKHHLNYQHYLPETVTEREGRGSELSYKTEPLPISVFKGSNLTVECFLDHLRKGTLGSKSPPSH